MICKDGQSVVAADIPFAGFRLKGVGAGTLSTDAPNMSQIQAGGAGNYAIDTGTADLYAIAPSPAISAYVVGQAFRLKITHTNVTTTPTLAVNGLTAGVISYSTGGALVAGALTANALVSVIVASTTPTFHLQTVAPPVTTGTTSAQASNNTTLATNAYVDRVAVQQIATTQTGAEAHNTTSIPYDDTIPQITEGSEYMTCAITPKSATSKLIVEVVANFSSNANDNITTALFQDATADALAAVAVNTPGAGAMENVGIVYEMVSGTTSATTFRVRIGSSGGGTITFNGAASARLLGGVMASSITITEIGI
jgi:hypothetical protein